MAARDPLRLAGSAEAEPDVIAVALVLALAAALFYAAAAALQQHAAARTSPTGVGLLRALASQRRWLAGIAATAVGAVLHIAALRLGPLALVQPIGVTGLVFALPLGAALHHRPVGRSEILAAVAVTAGLAGLLASVQVSAAQPALSEQHTAALAAATTAAVGACAVVATRLHATPRAMLLALGAGMAFGVTSALVRVVANKMGPTGILTAVVGWSTPLLVAAAVAGLLLSQSAYQAGSLASVMPVLTVVDPLVAITIGEWLLGEPVRFSPIGELGAALAAAAVITGTVILARSQSRLPSNVSDWGSNADNPLPN